MEKSSLPKLTKWFLAAGLTLAVVAALLTLVLNSLIDPNDYKSDIENTAKQNGITLSIEGNIVLNVFPKLGVTVESINFSDGQSIAGKIPKLDVTFGWLALLGGNISETNLPIDSISLAKGTLQYSPDTPMPVQFDQIELSINDLSLNGNDFQINLSAQALNGLNLSLRTTAQVNIQDQKLSRIAGRNFTFIVDQMTLKGDVDADLTTQEIKGSLASSSINLRQQISRIQKRLPIFKVPSMSSDKAFSDVSFNSEFNVNPWGYSRYVHKLVLDGQTFTIDITADQSTNKMSMSLKGDSLSLADYLPKSSQNPEDINQAPVAIFAPLAVPFMLWRGESNIELAINSIQLDSFTVSNLYANASGYLKVLEITSFNADLFGGNVNAVATLDLNASTPSFRLESAIYDIDLAQAFQSLSDTQDFAGYFNMDVSLEGSGMNIYAIQNSLVGNGQFKVVTPSYGGVNIEETICQATALFGNGSNSPQQWPKGTQLNDIDGVLGFTNGKIMLTNLTTGTGNLNMTGQSQVQMVEQSYTLNAKAVLTSATSSNNGCSVNKRLQNQVIPFSCKGSFGANNSSTQSSCAPDQKVISGLLKNTLIQQLGEKYFTTPNNGVPINGDSIQNALKGVFKKKLGDS
jgi:AsmA protein|tara:strand:+ start:1079 stop:2971 length:1893 start_codon:yes stop_codon:yes gene_type:complete